MKRARRPPSCKFGHPLYTGVWTLHGAEGEVCVGGGGGKGSHGLANRAVLARLPGAQTGSAAEGAHPLLEEEAGAAAVFDDGFPCALAAWPGRPELLCLTDSGVLVLKASAADGGRRALSAADAKLGRGIGEQKSCAFAASGALLALGDVEGNLRVVDCGDGGRMRIRRTVRVGVGPGGATPEKLQPGAADARGAVTGISLTADGSRALVVCESGMLTLWDLESGAMLSGLPSRGLSTDAKRARGRFRAAAFVPGTQGHGVMVGFNDPNGGHLYRFLLPFFGNVDTPNGDKRRQAIRRDRELEWTRTRGARAHADPITAMAVSGSGKLVATGTSEGDVAVFSAADLAAVAAVRSAHMVFVTGLDWRPAAPAGPSSSPPAGPDEADRQHAAPVEALLSVSADSGALVTLVDPNRKSRAAAAFVKLVIFLLLLALVFIAYFIHILSEEFSRVGL